MLLYSTSKLAVALTKCPGSLVSAIRLVSLVRLLTCSLSTAMVVNDPCTLDSLSRVFSYFNPAFYLDLAN